MQLLEKYLLKEIMKTNIGCGYAREVPIYFQLWNSKIGYQPNVLHKKRFSWVAERMRHFNLSKLQCKF